MQDASDGDTSTLPATLIMAAEQVELVQPDGPGVEEVVADKGYHSDETLVALGAVGVRSHVSEPERGRRCWQDKKTGETPPEKRAAQKALYANRRRVRGRRGRRLQRCRGEVVERTFAHMYETGGMRRVGARSRECPQARAAPAPPDRHRYAPEPAGAGCFGGLPPDRAFDRPLGASDARLGVPNGHRRRSLAQSLIAKLPEQRNSANRLLPRAGNQARISQRNKLMPRATMVFAILASGICHFMTPENAYADTALPPTVTSVEGFGRSQTARVHFDLPTGDSCGHLYTFYSVIDGVEKKVYGPTNHNSPFQVSHLPIGVPVSFYGIGHKVNLDHPGCRPSPGNVFTTTIEAEIALPPTVTSVEGVGRSQTARVHFDLPTGDSCGHLYTFYSVIDGVEKKVYGPTNHNSPFQVSHLPIGVPVSFYGIGHKVNLDHPGCRPSPGNVFTVTLRQQLFCPVAPQAPCRVATVNAASSAGLLDVRQEPGCVDCEPPCETEQKRTERIVNRATSLLSKYGLKYGEAPVLGPAIVTFMTIDKNIGAIVATGELFGKCLREHREQRGVSVSASRRLGPEDIVTFDVVSSDPTRLRVLTTADSINLERPFQAAGDVTLFLAASVNGEPVGTLSWLLHLEAAQGPVVPGGAVHAASLAAIRIEIDAALMRCGLGGGGPIAWTDPVIEPGVTPIRAVHVAEARAALDAAWRACGASAPVWTDAINLGVPVKALHFAELMAAAVEVEP